MTIAVRLPRPDELVLLTWGTRCVKQRTLLTPLLVLALAQRINPLSMTCGLAQAGRGFHPGRRPFFLESLLLSARETRELSGPHASPAGSLQGIE